MKVSRFANANRPLQTCLPLGAWNAVLIVEHEVHQGFAFCGSSRGWSSSTSCTWRGRRVEGGMKRLWMSLGVAHDRKLRLGCFAERRAVEQEAGRALLAAADAAAQLMQLRQPEALGVLDHHDGRGRNGDAASITMVATRSRGYPGLRRHWGRFARGLLGSD